MRGDHGCAGYTAGDGAAMPCGSPALPADQGGRCIRCARLQRERELARADPFVSINDVAMPGEAAYRSRVRVAAAAAAGVAAGSRRWSYEWPACLVCGETTRPHNAHGCCTTCSTRSHTRSRRGAGVAVLWVPFAAGDGGRYDPGAARRWVVARDLAEACAYLERRAAAGGIPANGKAVIRATSRAGELPETVIRRAA